MAGTARASVTLTTTLDLPTIARRLNDAELKILREGGDRIVRKIKARWVGWKYENAPPDKRGRSRAGWKRTVTSNTDPITLTIYDDAKSYYGDEFYVSFVKRRAGARPEAELAFEDVLAQDIPVLQAALAAAMLAAINEPAPPRRVRANKASAKVTETFT